MMANLKGWRTFLFNGLMGVAALILELAPILLGLMGMEEVRAVIPAAWHPWWVLIVTLGNLWLRAITTTPPGRAE